MGERFLNMKNKLRWGTFTTNAMPKSKKIIEQERKEQINKFDELIKDAKKKRSRISVIPKGKGVETV